MGVFKFPAEPDDKLGWEVVTTDKELILLSKEDVIRFEGSPEEILNLLWNIRDAAYHEWGNLYLNEPIEEY